MVSKNCFLEALLEIPTNLTFSKKGKIRYPLRDNGFQWSCYPDLNWRPHPYQLIADPQNASIWRFWGLFVPKNRRQRCLPLHCLRPLISYCGSSCGSGNERRTNIRERKALPNCPLPLIGNPGDFHNEAPLFFVCAGPSHPILSAHLEEDFIKPLLLRVSAAIPFRIGSRNFFSDFHWDTSPNQTR